ncbi:efflux RND transporter permease subunit [Urbifossiella limnaea]|uniref:Efflux pump membrane transporter BepE n=1 Tax=Urbifossiella limnaea TaxID=2528023 RepID=A0A517XNK8_9BACT|nr:multidrug efflux RND transporter permease subunit [Urbifossiella limnaea]QDU19094.1 Efflux pump membrane transporter BepE [Urbifossiella limnaea]
MSAPTHTSAPTPHSAFHFFIDRPVFGIVLSVLTTLVGVLALAALPVAQYPDVVPPQIVVTTQYPGASARTVAETVAAPIEQQINGVEGMLYLESQCTDDGNMRLTVTFRVGTDPDMAQVLVQNRVAIATATLPAEVKQIGVTTKKQSTSILMVVNVYSPKGKDGKPAKDSIEVSAFVNTQVLDDLARVTGVGDASVRGSRDYAMRVWLDPNKMADLQLTAGDVVSAVQSQNAQVAAGQIGRPPVPAGQTTQLVISTQGRLKSEEEFRNIVVKAGRVTAGGEPEGLVRLGEIARVELGAKAYDTSSFLDRDPAVAVVLYTLPGANALNTAERVKTRMEELKKERFPEGIEYTIGFDTTGFVEESIESVIHTLTEAFVLVFIVVIVFLQNWRAALIPMLAVPVALVGTLAVMLAVGFSINMLTLFGMVLAIGIVVDDAIVVVEAVEANLAKGMEPREATRAAMSEVGTAILGISMVLAAVFIPSAFIPGITGQFFQQFAITIAASTLLSAFNSLTLTPALCPLLLKSHHAPKGLLDRAINFVLGWFFKLFNTGFDYTTRGYAWVVRRSLRLAALVLLAYVGLLVATGAAFTAVPPGFIPDQDQGYLMVNIQLPDGASLERTEAVAARVTEIALKTDGVARVVNLPGYSLLASANISNTGGMFLPLKPFAERPGRRAPVIAGELNKQFAAIGEGVVVSFGPPPILGLGTGGGFKLQILDRGGLGYPALQGIANNLGVAATKEPGIVGATSTFRSSAPQLWVRVDRDRAARMGVPVSDINQALQVYMGSLYVNDITLRDRNWQVQVQADGPFRVTEEDLRKIKVRGPNGEMIPLAGLIVIDNAAGPPKVARFQMAPAADLSGFTNPRAISSGRAMATMEALAARELPPGMGFEWTEMSYQEKLAANTPVRIPGLFTYTGDTTLLVFGLSVLVAFLVMAALYESWLLPLAIVMVVPMCLLCAVAGLLLTGLDLNVFCQIGLVVLVGLATKNAILIVEFAKQKREAGATRHEAAVEAARSRLRPILMTSFAFILGVVPLLLRSGAGAEMQVALGTAVFSGMLGVTVFGVFLTPVFYSVIERLRGPDAPPATEQKA